MIVLSMISVLINARYLLEGGSLISAYVVKKDKNGEIESVVTGIVELIVTVVY